MWKSKYWVGFVSYEVLQRCKNVGMSSNPWVWVPAVPLLTMRLLRHLQLPAVLSASFLEWRCWYPPRRVTVRTEWDTACGAHSRVWHRECSEINGYYDYCHEHDPPHAQTLDVGRCRGLHSRGCQHLPPSLADAFGPRAVTESPYRKCMGSDCFLGSTNFCWN